MRIDDNKEFVKILKKAVNGDSDSVYKILKLYEGLIVNNSKIDEKYDEECREYIEEGIIKNIHKFKKINYF